MESFVSLNLTNNIEIKDIIRIKDTQFQLLYLQLTTKEFSLNDSCSEVNSCIHSSKNLTILTL